MPANKSFSQNFLIDSAIPQAIAAAIPLQPGEVVLEVGAGRGALTEALLSLPLQQLLAVEVDPTLVSFLNHTFSGQTKFRLLNKNILGVFPPDVSEQSVHVVGNLPYHMTGQILFHFCGELLEVNPPWRNSLKSLTIMLQREVAERLLAAPGCKAFNPLSIAIQNWFSVHRVLEAPPKAFRPRPKVHSTVIQLLPRQASQIPEAYLPLVGRLVKAGFQHPRKTLKNNFLANFMPNSSLWSVLTDRELTLRAQEITFEQWIHWAKQIVRNDENCTSQ